MTPPEDDPSHRRLGSIMAAAGAAKLRERPADETQISGGLADETMVTSGEPLTVLLPKISTDPLDELVDRMRPTLLRAVDALQVAAVLESDGLTDRGARVEYGYHDVFALAVELYRRLGPPLPGQLITRPATARRPWRDTLRLIAHGPLYVLPSAVFPAAMAVAGRRSLVLALVFASGLGWVFAGVSSHAAYRMLGFGRPRGAARVLRIGALSAPVAGGALGMAVVWFTGGGLALVVLTACQLAYQLASTVLVFYRREGRLALAMVPAVAAGVAYLVYGAGYRTWSVGAAIGSVALAFAFAVWSTRGEPADEPTVRASLRPEARTLVAVGAYGLCSAALLLHAEAPYLIGRLDVAVAVAPLILSMGVVEWRAEVFHEQAVAMTRQAHRPREFVQAVWLLLLRDALISVVVPAVLAVAMLVALRAAHLLSAAGLVMTAAHVALAGAYYLAFLLAGLGRYWWLCASMMAALVLHVGVAFWFGAAPLLGQSSAPLTDTLLYLGSVGLLQALFVLGLLPMIGQVRYYR
jgi:hypothetical protein